MSSNTPQTIASAVATPDTLSVCEARMVKVAGAAQSGKTEVLVQRCAHLLKQGVSPKDILVETTTAFAAQSFTERLVRAAGTDAAQIRVASANQICADVLDTPAAQASTGRVPRVLNDAEYKFFLEDCKTLGQKNRRMRTLLRYFFRQWANNEPEEDWVVEGEEADMLAYIRTFLTSRGAVLAEELAYLTARYLQSEDGKPACQAYRYVLCDDFQNMNRAQQTVVCLLADEQIVIVGNAQQTVATRTAYPCGAGFIDFDRLRHDVETYRLENTQGNASVASFAQGIASTGELLDAASEQGLPVQKTTTPEPPTGARKWREGAFAVKWNTPEEEFDGLTKYLRIIADEQGTEDGQITVLVPNRRWARLADKVLTQRGFVCNTAAVRPGLGGDPRDASRCEALVAYTKLNLLADPHDMVAWRSWCGIGNYLTNSDAWAHLNEYAAEHNLGLYEALEAAAKESKPPFLRAEALTEPFKRGQEFITKNSARRGFNLLSAIGAAGLPEFSCMEQAIAGDEDAETLFHLQYQAILDPTFPERLNAIRIATAPNMVGLQSQILCVLGAVDGFYPVRDAFEVVSTDEDRAKALNDDRRAFYSAVAKAANLLVVSYFSKADLEIAEQTKMQVARVRSEGHDRVALLRPSQFIGEGERGLDATVGGQQLLAEFGLD